MTTVAPAAILLLSGGLDSYTAGAIARADGFRLFALTVRYGQTHVQEVEAARRAAHALGVERHVELDLDLRDIARSALTGASAVPLDRDVAHEHDIPSTYVPARNTIFLSLALAWAETVGASVIVIGVNALDYSGYPDCRPEYIEAFERMGRLATAAGVGGTASAHPRPAPAPVEGGHRAPRRRSRPRLQPHAFLLRADTRRTSLWPLRQLPASRARVRGGRHPRSRPGASMT